MGQNASGIGIFITRGLLERPEDVDLADIVNQSEPRTRPLYSHFVGEARIALNPKYPRKLASEAEVLALRPELNRIE